MTITTTTARLTGDALLAKAKELGDITKPDLARALGYVEYEEDGTEHLCFTELYEALLEAKGVDLSLMNEDKKINGMTRTELLNHLWGQLNFDGYSQDDALTACKYFAISMLTKFENFHLDVAKILDEDGQTENSKGWKEDAAYLAKSREYLAAVRMSEKDEMYSETAPTDDYLTQVSNESLEVLQHFGAEAPKLLNDYSCALEDALIEQVKAATGLKKELAALKGEEPDLSDEAARLEMAQQLKAALVK